MAASRAEILERERRWAMPAGIAAILVPPLLIGSFFVRGSSPEALQTERFQALDAEAGAALAAAVMQGIAFALWVLPLLYVFRAAQARSDRVSPAMVGFVFIGPLLFTAYSILSGIGEAQIASDFVAQVGAGGDIYGLLEEVIDDSTIAVVGSNLFIPAVLGTVVAMVYVPLQAMRTGLLTRFFATLGMAFGVGLLLIAPAPLMLAIWFGWLGFVILGRTPKGRPPAWEAGRAIPWPRPGEEPSGEPEPASPRDFGVVEGEGTEVEGEPEPKDHSARRERARKRKRKRRG